MRSCLLMIALALASWFGAGVALAQSPTSTAVKAAPAEPERRPPPGFEPVKGNEARAAEVDANALVVGAYAAFFLLMFGFVIYMVRSQSAIAKEMKDLAEKLDRAAKR
jgi:hypothetical protein